MLVTEKRTLITTRALQQLGANRTKLDFAQYGNHHGNCSRAVTVTARFPYDRYDRC